MNDAASLLHRYARSRDEEAFRQIVARYFDFVHGVAFRRMAGNSSDALDVVQIVFTDLARKAGELREDSQLGGWLHSHTCFVAAKFIRSETRRTAREQEAATMNALEHSSDDPWPAIAPIVDEALEMLSEPDRSAILMRYFEGRDLRSVGENFRISEDAAQKRVRRALEKLKGALEARGVTVSVISLGTLLLSHTSPQVSAAPIKQITQKAISETAFPPAAPNPILRYIKFKTAIGVALLVFIAGGALVWRQQSKSERAHTEPKTLGNANRVEAGVADPPRSPPPLAPAQFSGADATAVSTGEGNALLLHVLNAKTKEPIASARVRVSTASSARPSGILGPNDVMVDADDRGVARIPLSDPKPSRLLLETSAAGFAEWVSIWDKAANEVIPDEFTVSLEPGVLIGGRVINTAGEIVPAVAVRFAQRFMGTVNRSHQQMVLHWVTNYTDSMGAWSLQYFPESQLETMSMTFDHPNYARTNCIADAGNLPALRERSFVLTLREGARVAGHITDTNGVPIRGALVAFGGRNYINRKETVSDAEGRYELKSLALGPASANVISVMATNFAPESRSLGPTLPASDFNFELQAAGVIRGRVQDARGNPLKGVRVVRERTDGRDDGIVWNTETDAEGRFAWMSAPHTPQTFYFGYFGFSKPIQLRNQILTAGEEEHVITIQESPVIKGIVKNAITGEPVAAFSVTPAKGTPERISNSSRNNEQQFNNGVFEIHLDEPDYTVVRVRAPGFLAGNFAIPSNNQVEVHLQPMGAIEGNVTDAAGRPVEGAEVVALSPEKDHHAALTRGHFAPDITADHTRTDGTGRFKLSLSAEAAEIVAVDQENGFAELRMDVFQTGRELRLLPWGRVEGTVLSNTIPVANERVGLMASGGSLGMDPAAYQVTTDASGRFTIETVPPRRFVAYRVRETPAPGRFPSYTNFNVVPGAVTYIELDSANAPLRSSLPQPPDSASRFK